LFPLPGYVAKLVQTVQQQRLKKTDARVQVVTETMNVLRMIKLFGWERQMNERVAEKREEELNWLWKRQMLDLLNGTLKYVDLHLRFPPLMMSPVFSSQWRR
jgi:ABC-type bacteriocin/lantibiotic exporter with double-glycine peptidase domain